jgi:hypothetical protein
MNWRQSFGMRLLFSRVAIASSSSSYSRASSDTITVNIVSRSRHWPASIVSSFSSNAAVTEGMESICAATYMEREREIQPYRDTDTECVCEGE